MPHLKLTPIAAALLCMSPAWALAQTADTTLPKVEVRDRVPQPNGRLDLDTPIDTGSRLGLTARETPATVHVVTREQIDARGSRDTQEIARGIPGVTNGSPPGSGGSITYRGFGLVQVAQLFNGIGVQYDAIAARLIDSWVYDRVEAIGGPSTFLFGAGAVGGGVNYVTKTAERRNFGEAQVRFGSWNTQQYSLGLNRQLAGEAGRGHFLRFDGNVRTSDGWVDGNKTRNQQFTTSLLSDLAPGVTHTLAFDYQTEDVTRPYWGTPLLVGAGGVVVGQGSILDGTRFKNYNSADGIYEQTVKWLRSITEWQVNSQLNLKNTLYAYDALRDYRNVEVYRFNTSNTGVVRSSPLLQRHDQHLVGNRLEGTYRDQLAGLKSDWAFGLDYSVNKQPRFPNSLTLNVSTVNPFDFTTENFFAVPGMTPGFVPDRDNKITTLALYLENRTKLRSDLALVTALRHDRIDLDLTNRRAVTAANPASFSRSYAPTTGRVGLVWDITPHANLYAQYATAADPPSGLLATAAFADVINNTELTRGRQFEIGSKFDFWESRGNGSVAYYDITRKNLSTPDPNKPSAVLLVGQQSARGLELALGLQVSPRFNLQGNLALVDPQYDEFSQVVAGRAVSRAGNVPTNTPKRIANLWADYQFAADWKGSLALRYVGRSFADDANTVWAPGYTVADAGVTYRINKDWSLEGRVRNLTDKVYALRVTGTPMFYLGEPRSVDLTLRARF